MKPFKVSVIIALIVSIPDSIFGAAPRCFEDGAQFHPEDCENTYPDLACDGTFGPAPANTPPAQEPARHTRCTEDVFLEDALKCAKTCRLCCERPEYSCKDKDASFCKTNKNTCVSAKTVMITMCPHTCGYCVEGGHSICRDKYSYCSDSEWKKLCQDPSVTIQDAMAKICPETCGKCNEQSSANSPSSARQQGSIPRTADCKDGDNCAANAELCDNTFFKEIMDENCKKTCAHCIPMDYNCVDKNSNE
ncbi:shK domain-like domain-containing protein [Ditylenchus destructor]|nr:shK domain-like domain-containing protein [Ditylenchus destructor]